MGFFSWKTQDTNKSIPNVYSVRRTFPVFMIGNGQVYEEKDYKGYGVFGGKDYYELVAEMNGLSTREEGIEISFSKNADEFKHPNIVENIEGWEQTTQAPEMCDYQGYFYDEIMGDIFG